MDQTYHDIIQKLLNENNIPQLNKHDVTVIKECGEGAQAKVFKCTYKGELVAMKVMSDIDIKCLIHEIAIMVKLDMEYIPKFYGIILEDKRISYITKFISGRTLDEFDLSKISFDNKVKMMKQLSTAITYMHKNNCIHRDLKAENVMLDPENIKIYLIDFGISKILGDKKDFLTRAKGTMHYLAPEVLDVSSVNEDKQIISSVTQAVDVWAFAALVSYIFSGIAPWCNKYKDEPLVIQKVLTKKLEFPIPDNITNTSVIEIIKAGTIIDYKKRKTMAELDEMIQKL